MNKEINELEFFKEKLDTKINLPESLSGDSIEKLIKNEGQTKTRGRAVIRRFCAAAVAACIVLTSVALADGIFGGTPESLTENFSQQSIADTESGSYDELLGIIKTYKDEYKGNSLYNKYYYVTEDGEAADNVYFSGSVIYEFSEKSEAVNSAVTGTADSYGELNLRTEGVSEADIFITDGQYLYCSHKYSAGLSIIKAEADGTLTKVWSHTEEREKNERDFSNTSYRGLYIYENYLIAAFSRYTFKEGTPPVTVSGVIIYDITDKSNPVLKRELALDGSYSSSRITDGQLLLISSYSISDYFYTECDDTYFIPAVYNGTSRAMLPCDCIYYGPDCKPETYVNIAKLDLSDITNEPTVTSYLGNVQDTYCTQDSLYVIGYEYDIADDHYKFGVMISLGSGKTTVTRIDITSDKAQIKESCTLEGNLLNSYSIDEHNGFLRVALNTREHNRIVILDGSLKTVGELSGIAEGEQIKSCRFMGDTAYLVTFVQTDPLFVIDLKDPESPAVLGEVKLPGFSSYLHPVGDGLLLGIGVGGTETGLDGSSKISLFDVSDPENPKEKDSIAFPESSLGCEAKALCKVNESRFLIPYNNWGICETEAYGDDYRYYCYTGCVMVEVTADGIELAGSYLVKSEESAARATFIGDRVYIMSSGEEGVAAFNMESGKLTDTENDGADRQFLEADRDHTEILFR